MISRRTFTLSLSLPLATAWAPHARAAGEAAPAIVAEVRRRMASDPVIRGSFEQRKSLKGFRHPVVSRGDFVVMRERGVVWRTQEPFPSSLLVTRDRVVARQADGTVSKRLNASEEPAVRTISETLFALMTADVRALAARFDIQGETVGAEGWRLALQPHDAGLAKWLTRVELEGDRFLRAVRLQEGSGDSTQIQLTKLQGAAALTPQEESQFD
jgi:hypothetical protein